MTDDSQYLQDQLDAHRRTLAVYLRQLANLGADHAPPGVHNGIAQSRAEIARLKAALRAAGVAVNDQAGDLAGNDASISRAAAQQLLDRMPLDVVPELAALPTPHRMTLRRNPKFVGRINDLITLAKSLKSGGVAAITTGIGGVGKTQLAAEFAHRYGQFFAGSVFWLSFADPAGVDAEIAACGGAGALELYKDAGGLSQAEQVAKVIAVWEQDFPRLLIFDNCDDMQDTTAEQLLAARLPKTGGCRVLVTSRRGQWSTGLGLSAHHLDTLPRAESIALLRSHRADLSDAESDTIAALLGDLPLALTLAGSYLDAYRDEEFGQPAVYIEDLRTQLLEHGSLQGKGAAPSLTDHEQSVSATFALSYQRLDRSKSTDTLAIAALARAACLAPGDPFPRDLLLATLAGSESRGEDEATSVQRADALRRLIALGLLERVQGAALRIHRLIQAFTLYGRIDIDARTQVETAIVTAAKRINDDGFPAAMSPILAHLRYTTDQALDRQDEQAALLCDQLSNYLIKAGDFASALQYVQHSFTIRERTFGLEHAKTISALSNLAELSFWQGDFKTAQSRYEQTVELCQKVFDSEHPETVANLNNLALVLEEQGEHAAARDRFKQVLKIRERILKPQDPLISSSLNNLAIVLQSLGEYQESRHYHERALAIREQVLGLDHPDTTRSLNNLAEILRAQGDYIKAQSYYERALASRERVLGPEHPDTALSLNNYAALLRVRGLYSEARTVCQHALAIREHVLGPDHPYTAITLNNLALIAQAQGAYSEALNLYARAYTIRENTLGADQPDTIQILQNKVILYLLIGNLDVAQSLCVRVLTIRKRSVGRKHLATAESRHSLGEVLLARGKLVHARLLLESGLHIREALLSNNHPLIAESLHGVGKVLHAQGDLTKARSYYEQALTIREQMLGPDHPDIATSLGDLADLFRQVGDIDGARAHLQRAVAIFMHALGEQHPRTQQCQRQLIVIDAS